MTNAELIKFEGRKGLFLEGFGTWLLRVFGAMGRQHTWQGALHREQAASPMTSGQHRKCMGDHVPISPSREY